MHYQLYDFLCCYQEPKTLMLSVYQHIGQRASYDLFKKDATVSCIFIILSQILMSCLFLKS